MRCPDMISVQAERRLGVIGVHVAWRALISVQFCRWRPSAHKRVLSRRPPEGRSGVSRASGTRTWGRPSHCLRFTHGAGQSFRIGIPLGVGLFLHPIVEESLEDEGNPLRRRNQCASRSEEMFTGIPRPQTACYGRRRKGSPNQNLQSRSSPRRSMQRPSLR